MIQNVRFAAHVNGVFTNARLTLQEASLVELSTGSSCLTTVDTTNIYYTWLDYHYNTLNSEETTKIPFPFKGEMCLEEGKTLLQKLFFNKDGSRNSSVAVMGIHQKEFFMSCGLKTVDMWSDMNLDLIPGELDNYPTPFTNSHTNQIHSNGLDHNCSRRKVFQIMYYLKKNNVI
ncbi:hypothetical protein NPIL_270321 [Nephila pilipes]|uniref:Uncharacterized protein n=1 Tax=Nephila pilipes TaxID=299642 RepID=A0A8X6NZ50_NEPPI|nr:hypothetical protein NPIL_270321 [Nephila pilipes]